MIACHVLVRTRVIMEQASEQHVTMPTCFLTHQLFTEVGDHSSMSILMIGMEMMLKFMVSLNDPFAKIFLISQHVTNQRSGIPYIEHSFDIRAHETLRHMVTCKQPTVRASDKSLYLANSTFYRDSTPGLCLSREF